jgi:hypothetical protein
LGGDLLEGGNMKNLSEYYAISDFFADPEKGLWSLSTELFLIREGLGSRPQGLASMTPLPPEMKTPFWREYHLILWNGGKEYSQYGVFKNWEGIGHKVLLCNKGVTKFFGTTEVPKDIYVGIFK